MSWVFLWILLFDYFWSYLGFFFTLFLLDEDGMHKYIICITHHLCSLKHILYIRIKCYEEEEALS